MSPLDNDQRAYTMKINDVTFKAAGEAGAGIATIGGVFAKMMQRCGLCVFGENDYPSLIRGGHNTMTIRANKEQIYALDGKIDVLVALNKDGVLMHLEEMEKGGIVIYDSSKVKEQDVKIEGEEIRLVGVPLTKIAADAGNQIYLNQVAMGATVAVLGLGMAVLDGLIEETFSSKGKEIVAANKKAAKDGYDFMRAQKGGEPALKIEPLKYSGNMLINGNDAVCLGALKAGVRFVAEYPMSPSSSVLHWMAANATEHDLVVKHTEDEIAAINYVLGAG
ncbi:MAG: 2-oxoacid:acceptor oxidoreductase family protein, partial [Candidatus Micrarchaeota archaeon]